MAKKSILIIACFILFAVNVYAQSNLLEDLDSIKKGDRILILAPHPDDETIGCAGVIQQAIAKGAEVQVVYLTNGDHNEIAFIVYEKRLTFRKGEFIYMGEVRMKEAVKAMKLLGLNEGNLLFLGYPDFGTFTIFSQYWQSQIPFKSWLTRVSSVPYKANLSYGVAYTGESILSDLKKMLLAYQPNKIFVSHPADVNVDHRALYLFLQIALRDLHKELPNFKVYPYLIHCVGWPVPRHYHPDLNLLPPQNFLNSQINWFKFDLTPERLNKKHQAIYCYKSQTESSAFYLLSFARKNELFGDYPRIELENQDSLEEKTPKFFGPSEIFSDLEIDGESYNQSEHRGQVSYAVMDNAILIRIEKTKNIERKFSFLLYLFGYSNKIPFAQMPKIRIIGKYNKFKVFEKKQLIKPEGVSLQLKSNILILRVPLKLLGDPDFILSSMKIYGGTLLVDAIGFRQIEIKR